MNRDDTARLLAVASGFDAAFVDRFLAKVTIGDGCWMWNAANDNHGCGVISFSGRLQKAHRVAHQLWIGPIPAGLLVDHKCFTRSCVNPDHLRAVTSKENLENRQGANSNSKSGVRSVSWCADRQKWQAIIGHNRRAYSAGRFDTIEEAEAAAIALRTQLFTHNDVDRSAS